jgi:hypothetical protein
MTTARYKHGAGVLSSGEVLVVGGSDERDYFGRYASAELFDLPSATFRPVGAMASPRFKLPAAVAPLPSGTVLIAGGGTQAEVYDPATRVFRPVSGSLGSEWSFMTATPLPDGRVLLTGGYDPRIRLTAQAWLYLP